MTLLIMLLISLFNFINTTHRPEDTGRIIPAKYQYYCNRNCYNRETHTYHENVACSFFPCLPSYTCGLLHKRIPFSDEDRDLILHLHNYYRNLLASGAHKKFGNGISDMSAMSYDKEMEFLAACWANQCKESPIPNLGRDKCRATELSSYNGQSHWAYATDNYSIDWSDKRFIREAFMHWYEQIGNVTVKIINKYTEEGSQHFDFFTQLVWSSTYLIGCGRTMFSANRFVGINIVCNYSPGGNIVGEPVFSIGPACSKYHSMKKNQNYTHLCGDIRPIEDDLYIPPFTLGSTKKENSSCILLFIFWVLCLN